MRSLRIQTAFWFARYVLSTVNRSLPRSKDILLSSGNSSNSGTQNSILIGIPAKEREAVLSKASSLHLQKHLILNESGARSEFAYFVTSGLVSFLTVMADGKSVEVGLTGKEGFVGLPIVFGFETNLTRIVMQVEGSGLRVTRADLVDLLPGCPNLTKSLQRFSQVMAMQAAQIAACNRLHEVDRRLARWLLMSQDRLGGDDVPLTQETLAHMLGTRRASVTVAAGILQKASLITYRRGDVKIDNRHGLETAACECYETIKRQADTWNNEAKARQGS